MAKDEFVQVVVAVLANESATVGALAGLKHWDEIRKDIELGSIATLQIVDGKLEADIERKKGKGPLISGVTGLVKGILGPYLLVGNIVGGVASTFLRESKEMTPREIEQLGQDIQAGGVAMIVVCAEGEGEATRGQLEVMGGRAHILNIPVATIEAATAALEEAAAQKKEEAEAAKAAEKAAKEAEKAAEKAAKEAEKAAKRPDAKEAEKAAGTDA